MMPIREVLAKHKKDIIQMLRYCITGAASFLADYLVFNNLQIHFHYQIANYAGLFIGLAVNYLMSKLWVFESKKNANAREITAFVTVTVAGFGLSGLGMFIGVDLLHIDSRLVKFLTAVLVFIYNFIARKFFIWKDVQ